MNFMMRFTLITSILIYHGLLYATNTNTKEIYKNKNIISEVLVYLDEQGLNGSPTCSISKTTKNGSVIFLINNSKHAAILTNSVKSHELFTSELPVHLSVVDSLSDDKIIDKAKIFPFGEKPTSRYLAEYDCKKGLTHCIEPYVDNKIFLTSGVNIVFMDSFNKLMDDDAMLAFNNCLDGI